MKLVGAASRKHHETTTPASRRPRAGVTTHDSPTVSARGKISESAAATRSKWWPGALSPPRASQLQEFSMAPAPAAVAAASPAALLRSSSPRSRRPQSRACSFRCAGPSARPSTLVSSSVSQLQHKLQAYPLLSFQLQLVLRFCYPIARRTSYLAQVHAPSSFGDTWKF